MIDPEQIAEAIADQGYVMIENALPETLIKALFEQARELQIAFSPAGVGRESGHLLDSTIRGDSIHWIERGTSAADGYLDWAETLRLAVNRRLFLGLFDYEAHFAHYPPGAYYERHMDAFRGRSNRMLTTVLYLNPDWDDEAGGELLVYPEDGDEPILRVTPQASTLVVFLSDSYPHEVLPARKERFSIAGWYRINSSSGSRIDPSQ